MSEVWAAIMAAVLSLIVALVSAAIQYANHKSKAEIDARAEQRRKESMLSLEMMMANNKLSYACAMAIKRGSPNGEIEDAVEAYEEAKANYDAFIRQMAVQQMRH